MEAYHDDYFRDLEKALQILNKFAVYFSDSHEEKAVLTFLESFSFLINSMSLKSSLSKDFSFMNICQTHIDQFGCGLPLQSSLIQLQQEIRTISELNKHVTDKQVAEKKALFVDEFHRTGEINKAIQNELFEHVFFKQIQKLKESSGNEPIGQFQIMDYEDIKIFEKEESLLSGIGSRKSSFDMGFLNRTDMNIDSVFISWACYDSNNKPSIYMGYFDISVEDIPNKDLDRLEGILQDISNTNIGLLDIASEIDKAFVYLHPICIKRIEIDGFLSKNKTKSSNIFQSVVDKVEAESSWALTIRVDQVFSKEKIMVKDGFFSKRPLQVFAEAALGSEAFNRRCSVTEPISFMPSEIFDLISDYEKSKIDMYKKIIMLGDRVVHAK